MQMKKISIHTVSKKLLADVYTPVGIYLRLRDRFRDTVLLESTDHHVTENSYSFIGINAFGGIEITNPSTLEFKLPGQPAERVVINKPLDVPVMLQAYMQRYEVIPAAEKEVRGVQGLFGYSSFGAVQFFDNVKLRDYGGKSETSLPLMRYRLYQYVIVINHFKDELYLCENQVAGIESELHMIESLIKSKDVPVFPFRLTGSETSNMDDAAYMAMVKQGIQHCLRGDVFQIVLSRRFQQPFAGDEFNVYRSLRSINPSPYLFYFDYGDYKLMGSSPEAQLVIQNGKAVMHPIAGTFRRTGDDATDQELAEKLLNDEKEKAEHVMLVDLARNDLSRKCDEVEVTHYSQVQYYSHVIHLVSEVTGKIRPETNSFDVLAVTFPAGTLSGAPKISAMQLIDGLEPTERGYYGGCIGFMGFDGSCNQAIMIRTLMAKNNTLYYQAGAGVVAASKPESELQEVHNKLGALKVAVVAAMEIGK
jgi:anthranilate synthase component I